MKTLTELRAGAATRWPEIQPSPAALLWIWQAQAPEEWAPLLAGGAPALPPLAAQLAALPLAANATDRQRLREAVQLAVEDAPHGGHLLRALCTHPEDPVSRALAQAGLDCTALAADPPPRTTLARAGVVLPETPHDQALTRFGRDLTALACEGAFSELAPRTAELERLLEVLLRQRKANPVLTGPAGVGKTALVELLAREIATQPAHPLAGQRLIELSLGKLLAGTHYRGEFEQRFLAVTQPLHSGAPVILFIDELHLLVGAGRAEGMVMDAANLLKPLLARDGFRLIGATTSAEYQRHLASDEALARRFQELPLEEPDAALVVSMVAQQASRLSAHHQITIDAEVQRQAIALTSTHQRHRHQPDKSIDLLDSAAVAARRAGAVRLSEHHLRTTLARQLGRALDGGDAGVRAQLAGLEAALNAHLIGQAAAVATVTRTLIQRRLGLSDPERPQGVFLFVGPTGVGKSELARRLAVELYGDHRHLLPFDMAEYSGPAAVHTLLGAPPGLVRSDEDGTLSAALRQHPSAVVLFDEIEKAHPEVVRLLLGLLEQGRITNHRGHTLDARGCVLILTSNALTSAELRPGPGFTPATPDSDLTERLAAHFPRELLGRCDALVLFRALAHEDLAAILDLRLAEAGAHLAARGVHLRYDPPTLRAYLLARLGRHGSGARDLARVLERELLQPAALALLAAPDGRGTLVLEDAFYRNGAMTLLPATLPPLTEIHHD